VEVELLNLEAIANAPLTTDPFSFFMVPGVLSAVDLAAVRADFPQIAEPGIFSLSELIYGPAFAGLIEEIRNRKFEYVIEKKYGIDLSDKPMMISVCGEERKQDGGIRTYHTDEFVTCLLYLNDIWDDRGGRLRILRSRNDLSDYVAEIPPGGGMLASFLRSDRSWHAHEPYEGDLRYVVLNWITTQASRDGLTTEAGQRDRLLQKSA
jgi:SM-20-related protein